MRGLLKNSIIRALIITVISALIIVGAIYAYETLWSGKAHITIEAPSAGGSGQLEVTDVTVSRGTWDDSTNTWTLSIPRGCQEDMFVAIKNTSGDFVTVNATVSDRNPAHGVSIYAGIPGGTGVISADGYGTIHFYIIVDTDAESGTLPEVQLEIRQQ